MNLPDYASLNTFFNREMGGYTIGQYVQEYYNGQQDKFHQQAADIDSKIQIIMELREAYLIESSSLHLHQECRRLPRIIHSSRLALPRGFHL